MLAALATCATALLLTPLYWWRIRRAEKRRFDQHVDEALNVVSVRGPEDEARWVDWAWR